MSRPHHGAGMFVDVAIVGGGGAGLSLVLALEHAARTSGRRAPSVAVIDPVRRSGQDRTWCWWASASEQPDWIEPLLTRSWPTMRLVDAVGAAKTYDLAPLRYQMLRSADLYAAADAALERMGGVRITASAEAVIDGMPHAVVRAGDERVMANWVFDSRPSAPTGPGSTMMLQHFRGWTVRFAPGSVPLDENVATLMDFSVPQPARGVAFSYCLPLSADTALVEYTEFSPAVLDSDRYDEALKAYLGRIWPGVEYTVEDTEDGVIPMTDATFARRTGDRLFRLGTAGGATRASTGYTFSAMQRQAAQIAGLLLDERLPVPPRPYPMRHRWMDAVMLRALDRGYVDGPRLFSSLFDDNPSSRVIRFLDGTSSPADELAIMRSTPTPAMMRSAMEDATARVKRIFT
ncbi:lycopene cyclase family protein [Kineosporia succinea]|uniref:Lycopene beta-cyclase n=1 Tax=Kineosporia succinea TaxID=84632 RepID=A0ABT9P172_9ACTN|nr:lycopene cyclase family protein [Kineosporia succinea]MDP9826423.1 lycopene beta-cyclase [Kineosporia succinea]